MISEDHQNSSKLVSCQTFKIRARGSCLQMGININLSYIPLKIKLVLVWEKIQIFVLVSARVSVQEALITV